MTPHDLGVDLIRAERERQIIDEGYTPDHDAHHVDQSLILAADEYLSVAEYLTRYDGAPAINRDAWLAVQDLHGFPASRWPWEPEYFKPSPDPIRNLVKAGALIAAEIDRLSNLQKDN